MSKKNLVINKANVKECPPKVKSGLRILLVEDDYFLRDICYKKLSQNGYDVSAAADGLEALEKIVELKPDLVLLDIILPGLDGFEVLKKIREHINIEIKNTPVVMLTNLSDREDIEKAMRLGANDYLIKAHFTTEEIAEKIKKLVKK